MQKREAHDFDPAVQSGPVATPRVSGEVLTSLAPLDAPDPTSSTRAAVAPLEPSVPLESSVPSDPSDTLLSAGKPADRLEVMLEDRLAVVDERLRELDGRLASLEHKKSITAPEPRQKPWLWVAFLIALAVVFQLLHRVR